jgi:transcriptional regulator with XRE-family HTH domain
MHARSLRARAPGAGLRAARAGRPPRFLVKANKGSTKAVAQQLGVSRRTVQRWLKDTRVHPKPPTAKAIENAVRATWQPRVKNRMRRAAEAGGFMLHTSAQFGFASAAGSTDDPRLRQITQHLSADIARRLFQARDAGVSERRQADILAEGLQESYFKDGGRRAAGLNVEFTGVQGADFKIDQ